MVFFDFFMWDDLLFFLFNCGFGLFFELFVWYVKDIRKYLLRWLFQFSKFKFFILF